MNEYQKELLEKKYVYEKNEFILTNMNLRKTN